MEVCTSIRLRRTEVSGDNQSFSTWFLAKRSHKVEKTLSCAVTRRMAAGGSLQVKSDQRWLPPDGGGWHTADGANLSALRGLPRAQLSSDPPAPLHRRTSKLLEYGGNLASALTGSCGTQHNQRCRQMVRFAAALDFDDASIPSKGDAARRKRRRRGGGGPRYLSSRKICRWYPLWMGSNPVAPLCRRTPKVSGSQFGSGLFIRPADDLLELALVGWRGFQELGEFFSSSRVRGLDLISGPFPFCFYFCFYRKPRAS